jgi:adenylate cyclase class IV
VSEARSHPPPTASPVDEIEVKARVSDPAAVRRALEQAGARLEFRGAMIDRRLDRDGVLTANDEVLRLRTFQPAAGGPGYGVLGWKGAHSARGGYRHRPEVEARVADGAAVLTILEHAGFAVSLEIDRTVEIYRLAGTVLRLEWYPEMDVLLEVEGDPEGIERAIAATGLPRDSFLAESLDYFMAEYAARTGSPGRLRAAP